MSDSYDYSIFLTFIDNYLPGGFQNIDTKDPLMERIEKLLDENNQMLFIGDIIRLKVLFTSKHSHEMLGIEPENFDPAVLLSASHPNDLIRNSHTRTLTINTGQNLFIKRKGTSTISSNFRLRNQAGHYRNLLFQSYLFFRSLPYETVYICMVITDISHLSITKSAFYLFAENDESGFCYPNAEMLNHDNLLTLREFEIMQLISKGLTSKMIADKLFLSVHTINTHRRNILNKSGGRSMPELVQAMKEKGVL